MNDQLKRAITLLFEQAKIGQPITYRDFATMLDIQQAPIIAQVASLLEIIIEQDASLTRPIFASLVVQKKGDIPRQGFFEKLWQADVTSQVLQGSDAVLWHQTELEKIKQWVSEHEM